MHRTLIAGLLVCSAFAATTLSAQTLRVRHDHDPWGGCEGELQITEDGIRYEPTEGDHHREWAWIDIQSVDRHSDGEFSVLTYEDFRWRLGLDRAFDFAVLEGPSRLDQDAFNLIRDNLARPVVDRVAESVDPEYQIAVKHVHILGGCEGTLTFGEDWIVYETDHLKDARTWQRQDIARVWSSGPFELELQILEENRRAFRKETQFRFQLKEALDQEYYEELRRQHLLAP